MGEGGHFVDTMSWWIGSDPVEVMTMAGGGPDEVQVSLRYGDGSLATISYLTSMHRRFPKGDLRSFERWSDRAGSTTSSGALLGGSPRSGPSPFRAAGQGSVRRNQGLPGGRASRWTDAYFPGLAGGHHRATLAAAGSALASGTSQPL